MRRPGTANIVQLAFFRGFGSGLTCRRDRRCGMVFRCLRKSARRVENCIFPLYLSRLCGEDRHCTPQKTNLAGNRDGARLYFLLSSTFLWCCNFQISDLERTLSGCLLSISFDFTPFPVKLISARTGIRMYTCRCISPNVSVVVFFPLCTKFFLKKKKKKKIKAGPP